MTALLLLSGPGTMAEGQVPTVVPDQGVSPDLAIAPNFERFDGLGQPPLENPASQSDETKLGEVYGSPGPRPGQHNQQEGQVYTPGALVGVVGTIGGQPLPVEDWKYASGAYTGAVAPGIQFRQGVGQRGPSELGAAQTTALAGITNNPPEPGDLSMIIAGIG
jgi:hypothetical protein